MSPNPSVESIISIGEIQLVRFLLKQPRWMNQFLSLRGVPDSAELLSEIPLDGLQAKGDIDVFAVSPLDPALTVAFQIKRVKVSQSTYATEMVGGLSAIAEVHRQSNQLLKLGFGCVFSVALIVIDARSRNDGHGSFNDLPPELRSKLESALVTHGLHADAGFVSFAIAQTAGPPFTAGTRWGTIHRMSTPRPQSAKVTEWAAKLSAG